jgi:hypothetical protein
MAKDMGKALSGLSKPGKTASAKRGTATMTIEAMPAKPKTFTDTNLDGRSAPGAATGEQTIAPKAKPGGSIKPEMNATPKMGAGFKAASAITKA